jgi:galactoside O-acetyltransferase
MEIHPSTVLLPSFRLDLRNPLSGRCYLRAGADCMLGGTFVFESASGLVTLGDRVFIGSGHVICRSRIEMGSNIFIAWGGYIYDHDSHSLDFRERRKDLQRQLTDFRTGKANFIASKDWGVVRSEPIFVQDDVWIGMHATILKGLTVGEGAVVGAGAVVTRDVPPWTVVGGNPARAIKTLPQDLRRPPNGGTL